MSMFSIPEEMLPNMKMLDDMMKDTSARIPTEFAATVNLMAHPLAGAAAMSALGVGFASHAFGLWFGAVSGATAASQRLFMPMLDEFVAGAGTLRDLPAAGAAPVPPKPAVVEVPQSKPVARFVKKEKPAPVAEAPVRETAAPTPVAEELPAVADVVTAIVPEAPAAAIEAAPLAIEEAAPVVELPPAHVSDAGLVAMAETAAFVEETAPAAAEAMPQEPQKPAAIERPESPDDLKAISGIGPKLEKVLNGFGVWTYAQIAAWNSQEIAWVDNELGFRGRIERDGWLAQAAKLAAGTETKS